MPAAVSTVTDALQSAVSLHLTAIEHYTTIAEHLGRWGYAKLAARFREESDDERGDLIGALGRLEYFNVQPTYVHAAPSWPRLDVQGILESSLSLEMAAASAERDGILTSRAAGDETTAALLAELLAGSEASIREIEADRLVISQIGIDNWLANQT